MTNRRGYVASGRWVPVSSTIVNPRAVAELEVAETHLRRGEPILLGASPGRRRREAEAQAVAARRRGDAPGADVAYGSRIKP